MKEKSVDVVIQTFGKPWQLLCTIESLLTHSEKWIDKIYLIEEAKHPFGDNIDLIFEYDLPIIHKKNKEWVNIYGIKAEDVPVQNIRHQWGIEQSDKKHVFICHNDVLFTGDVVGEMLEEIGDCVGIGEIGQSWNCPAFKLCGGGCNWNNWNPTWEEVRSLPLPHIRTRLDNLDKDVPKLMPECRLNEFYCLIDREACIKEGRPYFGEFTEDSGVAWFRAMYKKGYKFKDYRRNAIHAYWANIGGHEVEQKEKLYWDAEEKAKEYFKQNFE